MKKLFFAAAFAVVAIAGAFATNSKVVQVWDEDGNPYDCSTGILECTDQQYYSDPNAQNPIDVSGLFRNP